MDSASLASSLVSAQIGRMRLELAGKMLRVEANPATSAATTIEAAQQDVNGLDILAASLGSKLDVSARPQMGLASIDLAWARKTRGLLRDHRVLALPPAVLMTPKNG